MTLGQSVLDSWLISGKLIRIVLSVEAFKDSVKKKRTVLLRVFSVGAAELLELCNDHSFIH